MLLISAFKAVKHLSYFFNIFVAKRFLWTDFIFPSTLQLSPLIELLLEPIESNEITEKIKLGLHEALVNAVKHGNLSDSSKSLRVRRILTPNWFVWQIQDDGDGLPLHKRCSSLPSEIDANNGRGLFLINHCFDDIRWSRRGNRLQLASRRSIPISNEDSLDLLYPD